MANIDTVRVDARKITSNLTINLKIEGMKSQRARFLIAAQIIRLAAWVAGTRAIVLIEIS
jgi:hypothetical protein